MAGENSVVLVTGAARGIGSAIAVELARGGCDVAVFDVLDAAATVAAVKQAGRGALGIVGDVTSAADRAAALGGHRKNLRAAGRAGQQRRRRPGRAGGHPPGRRGKLRPRDGDQPQGPLLPHPGRGQLDDPPTHPTPRRLEVHRQHLLHQRLHGQPFARGVLPVQGGHLHGHQAVGGPAGRVRHRRVRDSPRHRRHGHDGRRQGAGTTSSSPRA